MKILLEAFGYGFTALAIAGVPASIIMALAPCWFAVRSQKRWFLIAVNALLFGAVFGWISAGCIVAKVLSRNDFVEGLGGMVTLVSAAVVLLKLAERGIQIGKASGVIEEFRGRIQYCEKGARRY